MAKSNVTKVAFCTRRHKRNGKYLLSEACNVIDGVDRRVAGFAILAWDDSGNTSIALQGGGPIGNGIAPLFIREKFTQLIGYE